MRRRGGGLRYERFHASFTSLPARPSAACLPACPCQCSPLPWSPPLPRSFDVLRRLVLPDGSVLRALLPGRPTRDTLFADVLRDGASVLKARALGGWPGRSSRQQQQQQHTRLCVAHGSAPPPCCFVQGFQPAPRCLNFSIPLPLQIWNMNSCTGVVGLFNLQGSSWDRSRRRFHIHDASPPELEGGRLS